MNVLKKFFPLLLIVVMSFFAFKPLFDGGFFPIHDDTQVARVFEMGNALKDGMFPVRWSQELGYGYGYPIFNYYDPLPYYIGGAINLLGFDALSATKLLMLLGILISAFSMYFLSKEFFGKLGGLLSSLLYVYAPYHAVDIYVRGDVAEMFAYAFIPLVFLGLWKTYKEQSFSSVIIASLGFAGVITSHNLTAMMITPFVVFFVLFLILRSRKLRKKISLYLFSGFILGLLISSFYSLPAILEMNYTNVLSQVGGGADFRDHFVCLNQFWTSTWGYGGSVKGCIDGVSFMIGKYHILLTLFVTVVSLASLFWKKYSVSFGEEKEKLYIVILSFLGFLFSIFLTLEISRPVWELFGPMSFFQYPWRFLIMIVFFSSLASGSLFLFLNKYPKQGNLNYIPAFALFVFLIFVSIKFFVPQNEVNIKSSDYTNKYTINWTASKISDEYLPQGFQRPKSPDSIADISRLNSGSLNINLVSKKTNELVLTYTALEDTSISFPLSFFPAWRGYIDGKSVSLEEARKGTKIDLPKGTHDLRLSFHQTRVEIVANFISLVGILALFLGIILLKSKKHV